MTSLYVRLFGYDSNRYCVYDNNIPVPVPVPLPVTVPVLEHSPISTHMTGTRTVDITYDHALYQ